MSVTQKIQDALATAPSTAVRLAATVGATPAVVSQLVGRLRVAGKTHIKAWVTADPAGGRYYPRPVYCAGPGLDAPKPGRKPRDRRRHQPITRVASVFHLGGLL